MGGKVQTRISALWIGIPKLWIKISICSVPGLVFIVLGAYMMSTSKTAPFPPEPPKAVEGEGWLSTVLLSLGTALVTVAFVDALGAIVREKQEKRFIEFFGPGSLSTHEPGRVILQADRIDALMEAVVNPKAGLAKGTAAAGVVEDPATAKANAELAARVTDKIHSPTSNRLYKARTWVNARDTEAAKAIRERFRKVGLPAPELNIEDHDTRGSHADAPYVISMGLGFTDETRELIEHVGGKDKWIGIDPDTKMGDAIVLNGSLIPGSAWDDHLYSPDLNREKHLRIFPKGWDPDNWSAKSALSKDYAIILRHRESSQTRFVLAGFTEDGTAAAGKYFAEYWYSLCGEFVMGGTHDGNFLAVICGPSRSNETWAREPAIKVTGKELNNLGINCPWGKVHLSARAAAAS